MGGDRGEGEREGGMGGDRREGERKGGREGGREGGKQRGRKGRREQGEMNAYCKGLLVLIIVAKTHFRDLEL